MVALQLQWRGHQVGPKSPRFCAQAVALSADGTRLLVGSPGRGGAGLFIYAPDKGVWVRGMSKVAMLPLY